MSDLVIETPRGKVYHGTNGKAVLEWNPNFKPKWDGRYSNAQKYVDSEVLRLCEPYLPFRTGMLIKLGILGTKIGSGWVIWLGPYARFLYYGKVMVGIESRSAWAKKGEKKEVIDKDLTYHGGGLRGSFWFARMKEISGRAIIAGAKKIAGGGK
jgi:hypothetical protein